MRLFEILFYRQFRKPLLAIFLIIAVFSCNKERSRNDGRSALVPVIEGDWWRICEMPDLEELAGPDPDRQHIVDHGFIQAENGQWQLWACIRGTAVGRLLYHWQGESIEKGPWKPAGIASRADPEYGEKTEPAESIQAPFFMKTEKNYYCFYNSNGARLMKSSNGVDYERFDLQQGNNIMYQESGRDVMLMKEDNLYFSYSTVSTVARDGWKYGFVVLRTSDDLKRWSDYTIVSSGGVAGNGPISAESPFVVKNDDFYYLFRSSSISAKTYVYRSDTPYNFGVNDDSKLISILPVKAPEIIYFEGQYYISDLSDFKGIKLARLTWKSETN